MAAVSLDGDRLDAVLRDLMLIPGTSGHEGLVRRRIRAELEASGLATTADRFGNLIATLPSSDDDAPRVMLFAHMDQVGFMVRRIEANGLVRVERVGGIPDKALPSTPLQLCGANGVVPAVFAAKSHHVTPESERLKAQSYLDLYVDVGFANAGEARAAGIEIGTPVVYEPRSTRLSGSRIAGTSIDDRCGCAVILEVARTIATRAERPTVHVVFSVQEEFNVRGAFVAAQKLRPDLAFQIDAAIATDTPDLSGLGEVALGGGPVISLYNFHGRGTLNGLLPHPSLVRHVKGVAAKAGIVLQPAALVGSLTDNAYVQFAGDGVACIDLGIPIRYAHTPNEVADTADMRKLAELVTAAVCELAGGLDLSRDREAD